MDRDIIIDNEFLTLWYYPGEKIVHHQIHKYIFGAPLREGLLRGAELLKTHGATKWLSDDRNNSALHPSDMEWGRTFWFPLVCEAGWKYWAMLPPLKVLGQMNLKNLSKVSETNGISVAVFKGLEEAMAWLRSM